MGVAVAFTAEAQLSQRAVEIAPRARLDQDEVHVLGRVRTVRMQVGACATREDRPNAGAAQRVAHGDGDITQWGARTQPHSGFPVRRGRLRNEATRPRSAVSGSSSRSR